MEKQMPAAEPALAFAYHPEMESRRDEADESLDTGGDDGECPPIFDIGLYAGALA